MHDHCAKIHYHPPGGWLAFAAAFHLVRFTDFFQHAVGQRIQHAIAGAGADDEIVSKIHYFLQIYQNDLLALFFFQGIDDCVSQVKRFQTFIVENTPRSARPARVMRFDGVAPEPGWSIEARLGDLVPLEAIVPLANAGPGPRVSRADSEPLSRHRFDMGGKLVSVGLSGAEKDEWDRLAPQLRPPLDGRATIGAEIPEPAAVS